MKVAFGFGRAKEGRPRRFDNTKRQIYSYLNFNFLNELLQNLLLCSVLQISLVSHLLKHTYAKMK